MSGLHCIAFAKFPKFNSFSTFLRLYSNKDKPRGPGWQVSRERQVKLISARHMSTTRQLHLSKTFHLSLPRLPSSSTALKPLLVFVPTGFLPISSLASSHFTPSPSVYRISSFSSPRILSECRKERTRKTRPDMRILLLAQPS